MDKRSERFTERDLERLEYLTLNLRGHGQPTGENLLTLFIRDQTDVTLYWYHVIEVKQGIYIEAGGEAEEKIGIIDHTGESGLLPYQEHDLSSAISGILERQRRLSPDPDQPVWNRRTPVGVVRYDGPEQLSEEDILYLVAVKYLRIKDTFLPFHRN